MTVADHLPHSLFKRIKILKGRYVHLQNMMLSHCQRNRFHLPPQLHLDRPPRAARG